MIQRFTHAALALCALGVFATTGLADTNCSYTDGSCSGKFVVREYTGSNPPPFCQNGATIVEVIARAFCPGDGANPPTFVTRCSLLSVPVVISQNGVDHTFEPVGGTWGDVLNGDCSVVSYTAN